MVVNKHRMIIDHIFSQNNIRDEFFFTSRKLNDSAILKQITTNRYESDMSASRTEVDDEHVQSIINCSPLNSYNNNNENWIALFI